MAHPASLNVPTDFTFMKSVSHVPIEINNAELDTGFTPAVALQTDAVMGDGQYLPGYFRRQFDGVAHGFAVRFFERKFVASIVNHFVVLQVRANAVSETKL
jgi:hypothetical protein